MKNSHQYAVKIITGQYQTTPSKQKKMLEYLFGENAMLNPQSLEQAIYHMSSLKKVSPKRRTITYDVNDKMAFHVVGDAAEELKSLGILLPQSIEVVYCDDVNCHMCCAEKIDDDQQE